MNEAIMKFKVAIDAAARRVKDMPESLLRPKHVKGTAWTLADEFWDATPLTHQQAGFLAGARTLVSGLVDGGQQLIDEAMRLWSQNVQFWNMANQAFLVMSAQGACTAEKGYGAEPDLLAQDIKAMMECVEAQKCDADSAYQRGYEAGILAEQKRLEDTHNAVETAVEATPEEACQHTTTDNSDPALIGYCEVVS